MTGPQFQAKIPPSLWSNRSTPYIIQIDNQFYPLSEINYYPVNKDDSILTIFTLHLLQYFITLMITIQKILEK